MNPDHNMHMTEPTTENLSTRSLTPLPLECRMNVLDYLSTRDLLPVTLVSKDLHASIVPFMYRTISWNWDTVPMRQILLLLRSILQRPELVSSIHHVSILCSLNRLYSKDWEQPWHNMIWNKESVDYADVIEQAQAIVNKAGLPDASGWNQAIQSGDPYALTAILLSRLHELKYLQLDYSFVWVQGYVGIMLRHALFKAPKRVLSTFNSLEMMNYGGTVRLTGAIEAIGDLEYVDGYPYCNPQQFMPWFYLPYLTSLSIWLRDMEEYVDSSMQQSNLHQLHTLILLRTTIKETEFPFLLSQTTAIKTFHLGMAYRWGDETALENGPAILQALESVSNTVEKLSLGLEYYPYLSGYYTSDPTEDYELRVPFDGFLKKLKLPQLRSLEIPVTLLLGMDPDAATDIGDLLPDTLEELCLVWDFSEMNSNTWGSENQLLEIVRNLLVDVRSHTPRLQSIVIRILRFMEVDVWEEERADVRARCAQAGIEMEVIHDELSPGLWAYEEI